MPELPEVETCRQGLLPHILHHPIQQLWIHQTQLRQPIPAKLPAQLINHPFLDLTRRGKYLLFHLSQGVLLIHLGMSGSLRLCTPTTPLKKHDHFIIRLTNTQELRYHDPRRFGLIDWIEPPILEHPLLIHLGCEPLTELFTATYLIEKLQHKRIRIKTALMDNKIVVGIGNIYANEILYHAKIHPLTLCCDLSSAQWKTLVTACKTLLTQAIHQGGTTLRDFVNGHGQPGYFAQQLQVYGRTQQPCYHCDNTILRQVHQQRATFFCPRCQLINEG